MSGWGSFILAAAAFFLSHTIPVRSSVKPWIVARIGAKGFGLIYSILSLVIFVWLIVAANRAPYVPLWEKAAWMPYVTISIMFVVCLMLSFSIARPNPFSFGGVRNESFEPAHPGIVRLTRHPLLVALALWSFAHLLPNGDLSHVILFAAFGIFALLGCKMINQRTRRKMSEAGKDYDALWVATRAGSLFSGCENSASVFLRLLGGLGLYVLLLSLHGPVIGVYVWP